MTSFYGAAPSPALPGVPCPGGAPWPRGARAGGRYGVGGTAGRNARHGFDILESWRPLQKGEATLCDPETLEVRYRRAGLITEEIRETSRTLIVEARALTAAARQLCATAAATRARIRQERE